MLVETLHLSLGLLQWHQALFAWLVYSMFDSLLCQQLAANKNHITFSTYNFTTSAASLAWILWILFRLRSCQRLACAGPDTAGAFEAQNLQP